MNAVVTVCRVTGNVQAPGLAQLNLAVDEVAAFLNQNERSFVGTCPGRGGTVTQGTRTDPRDPGRRGALDLPSRRGCGDVLRFLQVNVEIERVVAFLNQNPGSFVGLCPSAGDPNGTIGNEPWGYVTICRVTGAATSPLVAVTLRANEVACIPRTRRGRCSCRRRRLSARGRRVVAMRRRRPPPRQASRAP